MLEVCVDSLAAALIAVEAGAKRIELSERLDVGGVTPSEGLIKSVRDAIDVPLIVLVRCRPGDFCFDKNEQQTMLREANEAVAAGADGIAIGGMAQDQELDIPFLKAVKSAVPSCQCVVHRVFDGVRDPRQAIEQLVDLDFDRILTSGGPLYAHDGIESLARLVAWSAGRIEILPAGGIHVANAAEILAKTGCTQLHGSFRSLTSPSSPPQPDPNAIQQILEMLQNC